MRIRGSWILKSKKISLNSISPPPSNVFSYIPSHGTADCERRGDPQRLDPLLHGGGGPGSAVGARVVTEGLHYDPVARGCGASVAEML